MRREPTTATELLAFPVAKRGTSGSGGRRPRVEGDEPLRALLRARFMLCRLLLQCQRQSKKGLRGANF